MHKDTGPTVKEIHEIGTHSFSVTLAARSSPRASSLVATPMSDLHGTPTTDRLEANKEDRPTTLRGLQHMVLLSDSTFSGGSDLLEIGAGLEMQSNAFLSSRALSTISPLVAVNSLEQPSVLGVAIVGGSGIFALVPVGEPRTSMADVIGGLVVPPTVSAKGKEQITCPSFLR